MKRLEPLPYYKWLWRDWRANRKVQRLDYVARGLYRDLLDEQWSEGSIPSEVESLADICGCPVQEMDKHWPSLSCFFEEVEPGRLVNRKLEDQRTDEDRIRAARARAGKLSALSKLHKYLDDSTPVQLMSTAVNNCHIAEQSRADTEHTQSTATESPNDSDTEDDRHEG